MNRAWSTQLDQVIGKTWRQNGSEVYWRLVREYATPGMRILDLGGGSLPSLPLKLKASLGVHVIGVDIDPGELRRAPAGGYDETVVADLSHRAVLPAAGFAVSGAVIEHISDPRVMFQNVYSALNPNGISLNYIPNKFAPYALLNACLPNRVVKTLMDFLKPFAKGHQGFPAYYRRCYPAAMRRMLREIGFREIECLPFYYSGYLQFFAPLHVLEVARQSLCGALHLENLCEAFIVIARKG